MGLLQSVGRAADNSPWQARRLPGGQATAEVFLSLLGEVDAMLGSNAGPTVRDVPRFQITYGGP
jgi:hypothetical protein